MKVIKDHTLNLHKRTGDGIMAAVLKGVVTPFISLTSILCNRASTGLPPRSTASSRLQLLTVYLT